MPGCERESDRGDESDGSGQAVKNSVEQENMRRVHVQDGLVLTRFLRWVKEHAGEKDWTSGPQGNIWISCA